MAKKKHAQEPCLFCDEYPCTCGAARPIPKPDPEKENHAPAPTIE